MRFALGILIALGFLLGGLAPIIGGVNLIERGAGGDDIAAAFIIGGLLEFCGFVILWAVIRSRRKRGDLNAGLTSGMMMGLMMVNEADDFDGGADD